MTATVFPSRRPPARLVRRLRSALSDEHRRRPFSPADPRDASRRVAAIAKQHGLHTTVYRGSLDLAGVAVDHIWLAAQPFGDDGDAGAAESPRAPGSPHAAGPMAGFLLDQSFPVFDLAFVEVLRRWVAGDAEDAELVAAAAGADLDARVLGVIPSGLRYVGAPVWSARR